MDKDNCIVEDRCRLKIKYMVRHSKKKNVFGNTQRLFMTLLLTGLLVMSSLIIPLSVEGFDPIQGGGKTSHHRVYIIVADNIYNYPGENLQTAIQTYKIDIEGATDFDVEIIIWSDLEPVISNSQALRDMLYDGYFNDNLVGAVFVGDVPYAKYEKSIGNDYGFALDLFFRDLTATWEDQDNDNLLDYYSPGITPEIWIGRIKASNITTSIEEEIDYINNYFQKNHAYRTNDPNHDISTVARRGLVLDNGFASQGGDLLRMLYDEVLELHGNDTTLENIHAALNSSGDGYETVCLGAHGGVAFADRFGYDEIMSFDPKGIYYAFAGACGAANYLHTSPGQAYIFADTYGLVSTGPTSSGSGPASEYFFNFLKMNYSIADTFLEYEYNYPSIGVGITILGDPLLHFPNATWINEGYIPPDKPSAPTGGPDPQTGIPDVEYEFTFALTIGEPLTYVIKWGDDTRTTVESDGNQGTITVEHSFPNIFPDSQTYYVQIRAINADGAYSYWSDPLEVFIGIPDIELSSTEIDISLAQGETTTEQLTISNTGTTLLDCSMIENTIFGPAEQFQDPIYMPNSYDITSDQEGNVHLIWSRFNDNLSAKTIYYRKWDASTDQWNDNAIIEENNQAYGAYGPTIVTDNENNVHVIWRNQTGMNYRKFDAQTEQWGEVTSIGSPYSAPSIIVDSQGTVHVVCFKDHKKYVYYTNSERWDTNDFETMHTGSNKVYIPVIDVDASDTLHVIWSEETGLLMHMFKEPTSPNWSDETPIFTMDVPSVYDYDIEGDSQGDIHVTWLCDTDADDVQELLYKKWNYQTQTWVSDEDIVQITTLTFSYNVYYWKLSLIIDDNDNFHLSWTDTNQYIYLKSVYYQAFDPAMQPLTQKNLVNDQSITPFNDQSKLPMVLTPQGDIHVVWICSAGGFHKHVKSPLIDWLSVFPTSVTLYPDGYITLDVDINTAGLDFGSYGGYILIGSNDFDERFVPVPISLLVTSTIPAAPGDFIALQGGPEIELTWLPVTTNEDGSPIDDLAFYIIYRNKTGIPSEFELRYATGSTITQFYDPNIAPGVTYYYRITAMNWQGHESDYTESRDMIRGDANCDRTVDINDVYYLIDYMFNYGPEPIPYYAGDADGSCTIEITDVVYIIDYLFNEGDPPIDTCCWCD